MESGGGGDNSGQLEDSYGKLKSRSLQQHKQEKTNRTHYKRIASFQLGFDGRTPHNRYPH